MTLQDYIKKEYVGRILTGSEFGMNEPGCQTVTVPQRVIDAQVGTTNGDRDPCIWLTLENGEKAYFYYNEEIHFEKNIEDTTRYGLQVGEEVLLRCLVSALKENCVVSVRPRDIGFPSADLNVHRNDIIKSQSKP